MDRGPVRYPTGPRRTRLTDDGSVLVQTRWNAGSSCRPIGHAGIMIAMNVRTVTNAACRTALRARPLLAAAAILLALGGCATTERPKPIAADELAEAKTFPYYVLYWVGPRFEGQTLSAADGLHGYNDRVGDSVYYGNCVQSKGIFGGGSCLLPLQVTTVTYRTHSNAPLGPQRNMVIRGVPATVYDEGRSIELYSGQVAIDIFSDTFAHAYRAAMRLQPLNASGSARGKLPPPVYCPGLAGGLDGALKRVMDSLPGQACQQAATVSADAKVFSG